MIPWNEFQQKLNKAIADGILSPYLPFYCMDNVRQEYIDRFKSGKPIELAEYLGMRINSYERLYLTTLYTHETLCHMTEYAISNSSSYGGKIPSSYDEVVIHVYAKELVKRLSTYQD